MQSYAISNASSKTINKVDDLRLYVGWISLSFAAVFLPRILTALGAPSAINFMHYFIVVCFAYMMIFQIQATHSSKIVMSVSYLIGFIAVSTLANRSGVINAVLEFLLLSQPFLFFYVLTNKIWDDSTQKVIRNTLFGVYFLNMLFIFTQHLALGLRNDDVKGIFLGMGAGHHIAGAIALSGAVYALGNIKARQQPLKYGFFITMALTGVIFTDNKQTLAVFLISLAIFVGLLMRNVKKLFKGFLIMGLFSGTLLLLANTFFPALFAWAKIDLLKMGLTQKFSVFSVINSYKSSELNVLFGYGPGSTVGRLGQLLPDYYGIFGKLGATISPITDHVWYVHQGNWMSNDHTGSSMWSLLFSWAGVWGDLGVVGLISYAAIWVIIYSKIKMDLVLKFLFITIMVHGLIFQWMEEPAYMIFMVSLFALKLQEKKQISFSKKI